MLSRFGPLEYMMRGIHDNYARVVPLIRSSSKTPTTNPYQSILHHYRLSAAVPSTVASYSSTRNPSPATPPTTRIPRTSTITSTTTLSKPLVDNTAIQSYAISDTLNPPTSTLPPSLDLPPPKNPYQSRITYYLALGRAYLSFYKFGIKAIYRNWKLTRQLRGRIAAAASHQQRQGDDEALLRSGALSRAEFLLLQRSGQDIRKIPLFVLMYIVCGEFTPLVVVAFSGMVPRTLWIPKQVLRAREKAESRRAAVYAAINKLGSKPERLARTANQTRRLGQILGVYPAWWDRLPITPSWFISRRVTERLRLIDLDDCAIEQDGSRGDGVQRLADGEEVLLAAEMRGLNVLGRQDKDLKAILGKWLQARKNGRSVKELVLEGVWNDGRGNKNVREGVIADGMGKR